ncbi:MAG TPA: type I restriction-modification system subunit M N-terminal domain-containing protein, partial [Stellaceae bacterium]|nr:type I restriction-modification system subunit M N-terminal domain-containing protein [Stellaceae bacterium]
MEQMLWDAACAIRGEKDAAKFKDYLLPLLFLKRLSDVFDDEIERLAEEYGDRDTALEIAETDHDLLRFYLPPEARWAVISGRQPFDWPNDDQGRPTRPKDIGEHLTKAVRAVVRHNPSLSGVIDVVDFAAERNGERDVNPAKLREVVETFTDPRYRLGLADVQPDFLGRAYEYLLRKFAEGSGRSAGEHFTPTEVGFLMAHIMRPKPGEECHDYACGSAGLLVKLQLIARELDPISKVPLRLYGQELMAESYGRRPHERHHSRHERRDRARRHDDQSEIQDRGGQDPHLRHRRRQPDVEPGFQSRSFCRRSFRPVPHARRDHHRQGRLGLAAA